MVKDWEKSKKPNEKNDLCTDYSSIEEIYLMSLVVVVSLGDKTMILQSPKFLTEKRSMLAEFAT